MTVPDTTNQVASICNPKISEGAHALQRAHKGHHRDPEGSSKGCEEPLSQAVLWNINQHVCAAKCVAVIHMCAEVNIEIPPVWTGHPESHSGPAADETGPWFQSVAVGSGVHVWKP